jgi:hypothetical protein
MSRSTSRSIFAVRHIARRNMTALDDALAALTDPRLPLKGAEDRVPRRPGLYAIYGGSREWEALGLGDPPDDRPLYVGKAEGSLLARDLSTHFGNGRTGQSTVRRSMAALLKNLLALTAMPRNPDKPGYFSNYGLSPKDDRKLTDWMREHLLLATWSPASAVILRTIEVQVIQTLEPSLNLTDVVTSWTAQVKAARRVMADEARAWAEQNPPR